MDYRISTGVSGNRRRHKQRQDWATGQSQPQNIEPELWHPVARVESNSPVNDEEMTELLDKEGFVATNTLPPEFSQATRSEMLDNLENYTSALANLQYNGQEVYRMPGTTDYTVWNDNKELLPDDFMGESCGVLYHVLIQRDNSSVVNFLKPTSLRTRIPMFKSTIYLPFRVKAIAVDTRQDLVAFLSLGPKTYTDQMMPTRCELHFYSLSTSRTRITSRTWLSVWPADVIISQFDIGWSYVGISVIQSHTTIPPGMSLLFVNWKTDLHFTPQRAGSDLTAFLFVKHRHVVILQRCVPILGSHFVQMDYKPKFTISLLPDDLTTNIREDHKSHQSTTWFCDRVRGAHIEVMQHRREHVRRISLLPIVHPAIDPAERFPMSDYLINVWEHSREEQDGPFHLRPTRLTIAIKYEYTRVSSLPDSIWLFESHTFYKSRVVPAVEIETGTNHCVNGEKLIYTLNHHGKIRLVSRNLNKSAIELHPPGSHLRNWQNRDWISKSKAITNEPWHQDQWDNPFGPISVETVVDTPYEVEEIVKVITTEDQILFIRMNTTGLAVHAKLF